MKKVILLRLEKDFGVKYDSAGCFGLTLLGIVLRSLPTGCHFPVHQNKGKHLYH